MTKTAQLDFAHFVCKEISCKKKSEEKHRALYEDWLLLLFVIVCRTQMNGLRLGLLFGWRNSEIALMHATHDVEMGYYVDGEDRKCGKPINNMGT